MTLILDIAGRGEGEAFRVLAQFPAVIGRGYGCDVVLRDPHAGAVQCRIDRDSDRSALDRAGDGFTITDLDALNPTTLNGVAFRGVRPLVSGDAVGVGDAVVRVFAPGHPVPPPLKAQGAAVLRWLGQPVHAWLLFAIAILSVAGWSHVSIWTDDPRLALAGAAAVTAVFILVWAALWSVAGRLIRHQARFTAHVALAGIYLAAGSAAAWLDAAVRFVFSESALALAFSCVLNTVLLAALLYASLALAAHGGRRRRFFSAVFFSLGLTLGVVTVGQLAAEKFNPDPGFPYGLEPFLGNLAPVQDIGAFLKDAAGAFDDMKK